MRRELLVLVHSLVGGQTVQWRCSFFGASRNFQQRLERDRLRSGKSPYFTLSFSFQIIYSVKSRAGLLRNLCGNLAEKFVSDQSSGLKEMFQRWMRWSLDEIFAYKLLKKQQQQVAKGRFCINWTHDSSENILLKTPGKECLCKILRGRGEGANKVYYGWCSNGKFPHLPIFLGSRPLASNNKI